MREQFAEVDVIVTQLAQTDASPDIREAATELLAEKKSSLAK